MANHKTYTPEDLINAATQLIKSGKPVNGNALRRIIGTGRPASLLDAYNALVAEGKIALPEKAAAEVQSMESYDLPSDIKTELELGLQAIAAMVTRCNDLAHHTVGQRFNKAIDEAKQARIAAENASAEAEENEAKAWNEADALAAELEAEQQVREVLERDVIDLRAQLKAAERKAKDQQDFIGHLEKKAMEAEKEAAQQKQCANIAEGALGQARSQLTQVSEDLKVEHSKAANLTLLQQETAKNLGALEGRLAAAQEQVQKAQEAKDQALLSKARVEGVVRSLEEQNNVLQVALDDLKKSTMPTK